MVCLIAVSGNQIIAQNSSKTLLQTERMAAKLDLTEEQKSALDIELKEVREVRKVKMEKMRALREEMKRDAFVERQANQESLREILTEEQMIKLKEARKRMVIAKKRRDRMGDTQLNRFGKNEPNVDRREAMRKRLQMRRQSPAQKKDKKDGGS